MKQLLPVLLLLAITSVNAQERTGKQSILLINKTITSADQDPTVWTTEPNEVFDGHVYRLIQFGQQKFQLNQPQSGITPLQYIPKNAAVSSIEVSRLAESKKLIESNGGFAVRMTPDMKLSKRLFNNDIPDWAWVNDAEVKVWITPFSPITAQQVENFLTSGGFKVIDRDPQQRAWAVSIAPTEIRNIADLPFVMYMQEMEDPGQPENHTARTDHRINYGQSGLPGSVGYDGSGVTVGLGDDGQIGPHIDYKGRLTQSAGNSTGDHGDHVAGTIFGAGNLDPRGQGMAPGAEVYYQTYPNNLNDVDSNYDYLNVRITNSSYSNGCNAGYTNFTQRMDQDMIDNPKLLHIFSAGNNGNSNCGYGAGNGWGNVTGGHKIAKNVVAVANVTNTDALAGSSSRGPASDGRIKPDVSAVGSSVYSTTNPNLYTLKTGTSMACPGVAGVSSVLYEAYMSNNQGQEPDGGLLKAILMNSSDDLGNPGPDFQFGYGRVNAIKGLEIIENSSFIIDSISNINSSKSFVINVPANTSEMKIMLYWPDLPALTIAARAIVNDLDMEAVQSGTTYLPWVLDPTPNSNNLSSNAVQARDSLNNIEQITITNPTAGDITVDVSAFNLPGGGQKFYLVYYAVPNEVLLTYPVGGEGMSPGDSEIIRWDAPVGTGSFALDYSLDGGNNWTSITNFVAANRRHYTWTPLNNIASGDARVRVVRGNQTSESVADFAIIGRPQNLAVVRSCPDSLTLAWSAVNNADGYVLYRLGAMYMDSIGYSTTSFITIPQTNPNAQDWYAVSAVIDGNEGTRGFAIEEPTGIFNCTVDNDLTMARIISPPLISLPDCFNFSNTPVTVLLENNGKHDIYNFTVYYQLDNNTIVKDSITDTIHAGGSLRYTFTNGTLSLSSPNTYGFSVWADYGADDNLYNDTINTDFSIYAGTTYTFPYSDDFESFSSCSTNNDCGQTICPLNGGWRNLASNGNLIIDDVDWRVNNGNTPSNNTGPSTDHNPGTANGNYLYLEASGGCDSAEAKLISPCIDLSSANAPILEFWYNMRGANMGKLDVDIYDGTEYHMNVMPTISGNQGSGWNRQVVDLLPYVGKTIIVRFRGKTGNGFASDVAIDDINFIENIYPPVASFSADKNSTCVNDIINLTDNSANGPKSWKWHIRPATFQFENGTSDTSRNISIRLLAAGSYDVALVASNDVGTDSTFSSNYLTANTGSSLPIFEDFQGSFPSQGWQIVNPDGIDQWQRSSMTGAFGGTTLAAEFDNFNSPISGDQDGLLSLSVDLVATTSPQLVFDRAYAQRNAGSSDSLVISVSNDCGNSYTRVFALGGSGLSTVPVTNTKFIPASASDWHRDTIDLSGYIGDDIIIQFSNIGDQGNAQYLDNIMIVSASIIGPIADFDISDSSACTQVALTITDQTTGGTPTKYTWDLGSGANPSLVVGAGPHAITYVTPGTKTISLTVENDGGFSQHFWDIELLRVPLASYTTTINGPAVQFVDGSLYNPTKWSWDFGNGDTSNLQNPLYTYPQGGQYQVKLRVSNDCGFNERTTIINVSGIGLPEYTGLDDIQVYPNPTNGEFTLSFSSLVSRPIELQLMDLSGKVIKLEKIDARSGGNKLSLDIRDFARGLYVLRIATEEGSNSLQLIRE